MPNLLSRTPFVGREREFGILLRHLEAAAQGQGGVVLVGGEPGIGKTRLALEFAGRARVQNWQVLLGHAYESEGMPPYLPFTEALHDYVRTCPVEDLKIQLGAGASEAAQLLPVVRERLPDVPASLSVRPEHERHRLFQSLCDFLLAIAQFGESRGLLLVLDDLQWADQSTLLLLQHLARRLESAPMLVLGTFRTVDLNHVQPLAGFLADLSREQFGEQLRLASLAPEEAAAMIAAMTGAVATAGVMEAVYQQSGGTPFFLGELVRHLQAEGRDLSDPKAIVADWGVPVGVQQVISKRLARLSAEASRVLQMGAILGNGFAFEILQATNESESEPLLDALDEAVGAGMLREEDGAYRFSHDLVRQAVFAELSGPRRQRLHLRAAKALEQIHSRNLGPAITALAFHYRQAGPAGSRDKALVYARQAAEAAEGTFAWEESAAHLQAALVLVEPGDDQQRGELLLALGEAQQRAGELQTATETFRQAARSARTLPAPEIFARAVLGIAVVFDADGFDDREGANHWLEEALSLLNEEDSSLRTRVLARLASGLIFVGERDRPEKLSREALDSARRIGDAMTLGKTLVARHYVLWTPGHLEQRLAIANEIVQLAEEAGVRDLTFEGRWWRFTDLVELGDRNAFDVELPILVRLAEELRQPWYQWLGLVIQGIQAVLEGRFDEAGRLGEQAFVVGQRARGAAATLPHFWQANELRWLRGRHEDLEAIVTTTEAFLKAKGQTQQSWPYSLPLLGRVYRELGREAEARSVYDHGLTAKYGPLWILDDGRSQPWAPAMRDVAHFCQLCVSLGDVQRAADLYDWLVPYARQCFVTTYSAICVGAFGHYLGLLAAMLGRFTEAAQHFEEAIAINSRLGGRPFVAQSQHAYAAMLLKRRAPGDMERARELLEQALAIYGELGMEHWLDKAETLLAELSPTPARATLTYPDGLSAREVEVLRRGAAGKSNQAIADTLFISLSTVLHHMSHIFAKTGAANRADATSYAHRHRLTS